MWAAIEMSARAAARGFHGWHQIDHQFRRHAKQAQRVVESFRLREGRFPILAAIARIVRALFASIRLRRQLTGISI